MNGVKIFVVGTANFIEKIAEFDEKTTKKKETVYLSEQHS
jgi:hypothetical protein